jgi:4-amino-4-deoxy-L-arabinose transferase-like glycosyltransferase
MLEALILLAIAALLGLYAVRELAPARWAAGMGKLRRLAVLLPPPPEGALRAPEAIAQDGSVAGATLAGPPPGDRPSQGMAAAVTTWAALAIVALAFALRVIQLTGSPYGFFCDEASNALDAYWLAHTLHDQHGDFLPAYFEALNDWRGGFHIYWEVPFVTLFGLDEIAVRLGSAVAGTLTVWLTYLFVGKALNRTVGLMSAFLLATSPWHILHSRVGWEEISLPFVIALCLTFLYVGLEHPRWLPLAFVSGAVGMYTYQPGRVFFPPFCLACLAIYTRPLWRHRHASGAGVIASAVVLIPTIRAILDGTFFARLSQLNGPPQPLAHQVATFWANYLAHFAPAFLFQTSTDIILRHYVRGFGMLYSFEAPFLLIGVATMIWRHRRADLLFLAWLVVYPVAAALVGPPISTRSIAGVIVFQIAVAQGLHTTGLGILWMARCSAALRLHRRALITGLAGALLLVGLGATGDFMHAYLVDYPRYSSGWWGWQWGAQPIVAYFEAHSAAYDHEYMNADFNAPDELLRFYTTPQGGRCAACGITNIADPNVVHAHYVPQQRELWAVSPGALDGSVLRFLPHRIVSHLSYPDGSTAFLFVATGPGSRSR